jgi:cytochrome b6-f complex iron-sulfur subunit
VVPSSLVNGAVVVQVDATSPLANVAGAALTEVFVGGIFRFILIARTGAQTFSALNGVCTHEGCTVTRFAAPIFECPCHGSRYDTDGNVVQGPAPASLPRLDTFFDAGTLSIRV